ncbi:MAG: anhydro-N-acetylmuramic acid kinase [Salinimicrobium sp.]
MAIFTAVKKNNYNVIGVMSGTSLDGVDLALLTFTKNSGWSYKILAAETVPYSAAWEESLSKSAFLEPQDFQSLNEEYTDLLAEVILSFLRKHQLKDLDAVCSHGHTVRHEPENRYTLQIGNLPKLAKRIGELVVCDFRVQDVEMGGQGAPLVPIGDELLFPEYEYCLNLGGFANISTRKNGHRIAYDICAVNTVLNFLSNKLGKPFDADGAFAASGELNEDLLKRLNFLPFYSLQPPKSLGIEWVNRHIFPLFDTSVPVEDLLHTYSIHAAVQIASEIKGTSEEKVLLTGGGTFNSFLIEQIRKRTAVELVIPSKEVVNFKEALIFGFLGVLKLRGENNVLSAVTGAPKDHSSGTIFKPD